MRRLIVIIGRTCSGKSTLAKSLSEKLKFPVISIGKEIRSAIVDDEGMRAAYVGKNGFSDEQITQVLKNAMLRTNLTSGAIIEGSIGLGSAVSLLIQEIETKRPVAFYIKCESKIRLERFQLRNNEGSRIEHHSFFHDREALFDDRLPKDIELLKACTVFQKIDGSMSRVDILQASERVLRQHWY